MNLFLTTVAAFFPPDLSWSYLSALNEPILESLGMSVAAMTIAFMASLPIGLVIGLDMPGARALQGVLATLRAIPDLTMAILCVVLFGIGTGAGTIALALFYTVAVAKMFGDLFRTAPSAPIRALRATGAGRLTTALFGLIPLKSRDLLTYGSYEFESALRASIIIGAVGGGGLGSELVGTLSALDYRRTATLIIVLVLLVALIDKSTVLLRRHPVLLWPLLPLGFAAFWFYGPDFLAFGHALDTFAKMLPPVLTAKDWARLPQLLWETIFMALAGTAFAVMFAVPLGMASARNIAPALIAVPVRRLLEALRAVPEVVWGLLLIVFTGVGPTTGALALGIHSLGCLGRLYAECFENVPKAPVVALAATGASPIAIAGFATVPLATGPIAVHSLFRLEWNLRMATVVGLIGAGGIGQALYDYQQLMFYRPMMAYVLVTAVLIISANALSEYTRRKLGWAYIPH